MDDRTTGDSPHEILLALAGRIDDDLLAWCRELVAVGEDGRALELITATLVADGTTLPPRDRAAVVAAARAARTDLDAGAALLPAGPGDETPHRFAAGRGVEDLAAAVGALPERLVAGCRTWVTFRTTPAGSAPGPLPQPVVLVEVDADDSRPVDVLAYQLATACVRVGAPTAAVEVVVAGAARPEYQQAALLTALPVHGAVDAPLTDPYGTAAYRPDPWDSPLDGAVDTESFAVQSLADAPVDAPVVHAVAAPEPVVVEREPSVEGPAEEGPAGAETDDRAAGSAVVWPTLGSLVMPPGPRPVVRRSPIPGTRFPDAEIPDAEIPDSGFPASDPSWSSADADSGDPREVEPSPSPDDFRPLSSGPMDWTPGTAPLAPPAGEPAARGTAADGTVSDGPVDDGTAAHGTAAHGTARDWTAADEAVADGLAADDGPPAEDPVAYGTAVHRNAAGEAAVGEAAVGEAAVGEAAVGEAAVGEAAVGEAAVGEAAATGTAAHRTASVESAGRPFADRPPADEPPTDETEIPRAPVTPLRARTEPPRPRPTAVPPLPRPVPSPSPGLSPTPLARRRPLAPVADATVRSLPSPGADTPALASIGDPFSGPIQEPASLTSTRREPTIDEADPLGLGRLPLPVEPLPDEDDFPIEDSKSSAAESWLADWISGDWAMPRSATTSDPPGTDLPAAGSDGRDPLVSDTPTGDPPTGNTPTRDADGSDAGPSSAAPLSASRSDAAPSGAADPFAVRADDRPVPDPWTPGGRLPDRPLPDRPLPERRIPGRQFPVRPTPFGAEPPEPATDPARPSRRPAPRPAPAPHAETPMEQTSFVLPPESVARLSEADRELLARLQSELGDTPRPRATRRAGIGGNGAGPPVPNGRDPHPAGPPDLAG